jgi:GAF domain-containing protein
MARARVKNPLADPVRLAALRGTGLIGAPREDAFDRLSGLARKVLQVPIGMVSLVDDRHLHVKSCAGLPGLAKAGRVPASESFCQHVVITQAALVVDDAREHELTCDLAIVKAGKMRAYAGVPLRLHGGSVVGTLCVADVEPRAWKPDEIDILEDLAASVVTEIELRTEVNARERAEAEAQPAAENADLDVTVLRRLTADTATKSESQQMVRYLAGMFREDSRRGLKQVADALRHKDAQGVARAAHALKGSSGQLGATRTEAISAELEAVAVTGELGSAKALLRRLETAVDAAQSALSSALPEGTAK